MHHPSSLAWVQRAGGSSPASHSAVGASAAYVQGGRCLLGLHLTAARRAPAPSPTPPHLNPKPLSARPPTSRCWAPTMWTACRWCWPFRGWPPTSRGPACRRAWTRQASTTVRRRAGGRVRGEACGNDALACVHAGTPAHRLPPSPIGWRRRMQGMWGCHHHPYACAFGTGGDAGVGVGVGVGGGLHAALHRHGPAGRLTASTLNSHLACAMCV